MCDQNREETKANKRKCPGNPVQVQSLWMQPEWNQKDYGGKDLWNRSLLKSAVKSREVEKVTDGERVKTRHFVHPNLPNGVGADLPFWNSRVA